MKGKGTIKMTAALLCLLMVSPTFLNRPIKTEPTITKSSKTFSMELCGATISVDQLKIITEFPNGTKEVFLSLASYEIPGIPRNPYGMPVIRTNATYWVYPPGVSGSYPKESLDSQQPVSEICRVESMPPRNPTPTPWPTQNPPPLPPGEYSYWDSIVTMLTKGTKHPTNGDLPFYIKFLQVDNYYNNHPRNFYDPWSYTHTTPTTHIGAQEVEAYIDGIEDMYHYMESTLSWISIYLGFIDTVVGFFSAVLSGGTLKEMFTPYEVAMGLLQFWVETKKQEIADRGYEEREWATDVLATSAGDSFQYVDIREGYNSFWFYTSKGTHFAPSCTGPWTVIYLRGVRTHVVAFGKELEQGLWTTFTSESFIHYISHRQSISPSLVDRLDWWPGPYP